MNELITAAAGMSVEEIKAELDASAKAPLLGDTATVAAYIFKCASDPAYADAQYGG